MEFKRYKKWERAATFPAGGWVRSAQRHHVVPSIMAEERVSHESMCLLRQHARQFAAQGERHKDR